MNFQRCIKNKPINVSEMVDDLVNKIAKKSIKLSDEEMEKQKYDMLKYRFDII